MELGQTTTPSPYQISCSPSWPSPRTFPTLSRSPTNTTTYQDLVPSTPHSTNYDTPEDLLQPKSPDTNPLHPVQVKQGQLTGINPIPETCQCAHCEKEFRWLPTLTQHTDLLHYNSKPHACGTCTSSFSRMTNLTTHIKTHNSKGGFQCEICAKALHQDTDL